MTLETLGTWFFAHRGPISSLILIGLAVATWRLPGGDRLGSIGDLAGVLLVLGAMVWRGFAAGTVAMGTSGRNRSREHVAKSLNTTGLYSIVRHPLYLANLVAWVGVGLLSGFWWMAPVMALIGGLFYYPIIVSEQTFLERQFGEQYRRWALATPAMVPRLGAWTKPDLPYSWSELVRREHPSLVVTSLAIYVIHLAKGVRINGNVSFPVVWTVGLAFALIAATVFKIMTRTTLRIDPPLGDAKAERQAETR